MERKEIWRIQCENGKCPYHHNSKNDYWLDEIHSIETGRPSMYDDTCIVNKIIKGEVKTIMKRLSSLHTSSHLFGFLTLDQLISWFSEKEIINLYKLGFKIVKCIGEDVFATEKQAIFKPIEIVDEIPGEEETIIDNLLEKMYS